MPYFSIIVPTYNRERHIGPTIESCLAQDFADFEVIVVDDGSSDGSREVVRGYADPRIRLICQENRGVGPARNAGIEVSSGEWLVMNDSDDHLLPDALSIIHDKSKRLTDDFDRMAFNFRLAGGGFSPNPPLEEGIQDYLGYVCWSASVLGPTDVVNCVRRKTFEHVRYSESRTSERLYHLDFARRYLSKTYPECVALKFQDAENSYSQPIVSRWLLEAPDFASMWDEVMMRHSQALRAVSYPFYLKLVREYAQDSFLAGRRSTGLRRVVRYVLSRPADPKAWIILLFGLAGPRPLAWVRAAVRGKALRRTTVSQ